MQMLQVGPDWARQIAAIRDAHTDDTNLVRFGNNFYRVCRSDGHRFDVGVMPSNGMPSDALRLTLDSRDLYVNTIGGHAMGRYPSTFDLKQPGAGNLDDALHTLIKGSVASEKAFMMRSLVVFCVAESIRNDHLATDLQLAFSASRGQILGVATALDLQAWRAIAHQWGQACEAIFASLSPAMLDILRRGRGALTSEQRRHSEYVDIARLPPRFRRAVQTFKVLIRPPAGVARAANA